VALFMFFLTLEKLPLAVATAVQYLSPITTIIFAIYLNNQKVKPEQWLFFLISFGGILIMRKESLEKGSIEELWPLAIGVGSAILSGLAYNSIIKCKSTDHPITIVMYFPLIAIPLMSLVCFFDKENFRIPHGNEWGFIMIIGVLTQLAQIFMTKALTSERAAIVTPYKYTGSIFAVSFGILFFGEYLSMTTILGIFVVILGVLMNTLYERKQKLSH